MKLIKLGEICNMSSGGTPRRGNDHFYNGEISWAKIGDLETSKDGIVWNTKEAITKEGLQSINNRIFDKGTLFLAMYGSVGKVPFAGKRMSCNQAILGISPKDDSKISMKFLKYWFEKTKEKLLGDARGVALKNISATIVKNLQIPLPPLPEQKQIAGILDKAEALRKKSREILEQYDKLAQSIFLEMFGDPVTNPKGWEISTIGKSCYFIKDGPHVSPNYTEEGIPFISVNNIIKGYWNFSKVKYISHEDHEIFKKRCNPEMGDILYTKGGTTGFAKLVDIDLEFSNWVHLAVLKFDKSSLNGRFFEYMLNSGYCYAQSQRYTRGIANRDLVLGQMKNIKHLLPNIELQNEFASIIENIEKQKTLAKQSLKESEDLFNALLQKAFKGELKYAG